MRKVLFKRYISPTYIDGKAQGGIWEQDYTHKGLFHQWALSWEDMSDISMQYTYAIVELPDGTIEEVLPQHLKFVND